MNNNGVHFMMPTVFNDSGKIDLESMINITKFAKDSGCVGIVLLGVMGEAHRLSEEERNLLIKEISNSSKKLSLILTIGVSAESGYLVSKYSETASNAGAEQVMVAPPIMKKPNEKVLHRYYEEVNNSIDDNTKIVIQDLPDQSGVYMSPEFMVNLDKSLEKVNSIKLEDPPTPSKISKIVKIKSKDLKIFGGLGGLFFLEELLRGASGTMTGFAFTEILVQIYDLYNSKKTNVNGETKPPLPPSSTNTTLYAFQADIERLKRELKEEKALNKELLEEAINFVETGKCPDLKDDINRQLLFSNQFGTYVIDKADSDSFSFPKDPVPYNLSLIHI